MQVFIREDHYRNADRSNAMSLLDRLLQMLGLRSGVPDTWPSPPEYDWPEPTSEEDFTDEDIGTLSFPTLRPVGET